MATKSTKSWQVTVKHSFTRKVKNVVMPGGLLEADALRGAASKAGPQWNAIAAHHVDLAAVGNRERTLDLCCRAV